MDTWDSPQDISPLVRRVEVYHGDNNLHVKTSDLTVSRLSQIFKINPQNLYLEEDISKNAEFPNADGHFHLAVFSKYRVCGDPVIPVNPASAQSDSSSSGPRNFDWSVRRQWLGGSEQQGKHTTPQQLNFKKSPTTVYEPFFKRTVPFVTLALDHTGRNIVAQSTCENVYVRIPESAVSVPAILEEAGKKLRIPGEDLTILDSKWIPVSDTNELDFWKCPSRRLYLARVKEYETILQKRDKRRSLSLSRKRKTYVDITSDDDDDKIAKMEANIDTLNGKVTQVLERSSALQQSVFEVFECNICKCLPTSVPVITTCCNQLLGCQGCYERLTNTDDEAVCPLCRNTPVTVVPLRGMQEVYKNLERFTAGPSSN